MSGYKHRKLNLFLLLFLYAIMGLILISTHNPWTVLLGLAVFSLLIFLQWDSAMVTIAETVRFLDHITNSLVNINKMAQTVVDQARKIEEEGNELAKIIEITKKFETGEPPDHNEPQKPVA